jgi:hypothetical protein
MSDNVSSPEYELIKGAESDDQALRRVTSKTEFKIINDGTHMGPARPKKSDQTGMSIIYIVSA